MHDLIPCHEVWTLSHGFEPLKDLCNEGKTDTGYSKRGEKNAGSGWIKFMGAFEVPVEFQEKILYLAYLFSFY